MRSAVFALLLCACSSPTNDVGDAGPDAYGHKTFDGSGGFDAPDETTNTPWNRMDPHSGVVIDAMRLHAIYVTNTDAGLVGMDDVLAWIISSPDYWSILSQYGVGYGTVEGSSVIEDVTFFSGDIHNGLVSYAALAASVANAAAQLPPNDGGAPNAFIVFLPPTADVDFGDNGCGTLGYHGYTVSTPYAVIRPCGLNGVTIAHELAEMATDPIPNASWFSEDDRAQTGGGEVGDLCNLPVKVDGHMVTELWSNADGQCEP